MELLRIVTDARNAAKAFLAAMVFLYVLTPVVVYFAIEQNPYFLQLSGIAFVGCATIALGSIIGVVDSQFSFSSIRIPIPSRTFHTAVWISFVIFAAVVILTADAVPLLNALKGNVSSVQLDEERANFLKLRSGWQGVLPYISGLYTGVLLPYSVASLFIERARTRHVAFAAFLLYSLLYLQKSLFIQVLAPLFYLAAQRKALSYKACAGLVVAALALMYFNTKVSVGKITAEESKRLESLAFAEHLRSINLPFITEAELAAQPVAKPSHYFTSRFDRKSTAQHILWRAYAVPVFTAADSLQVFAEKYGSKHFLGATSRFFSTPLRMQRVPFESDVFAFQFTASELGSANSTWLIEAFVNFGWAGVIIIGLCIGQTFRWFALSDDEAFRSMWPLWSFNILVAGAIGSLFSSGFAALFVLGIFVKLIPLKATATAEQGATVSELEATSAGRAGR